MKRCPECRRDYYDDSLMYCLEDGTGLIQGSVPSPDEPATQLISPHVTSDDPTRSFRSADIPAGSISAVPQARNKTNVYLAMMAVAIIALASIYFGYRYFNLSGTGQIESIAVMPFVNESGNADVEYLSDGITETLIKSLSLLPDKDVKPRSAVFRYKGKDLDVPTVGKELNVQAILNGRVVQRGDQLALSLELVDVKRNRVIWTEQYQRRQADVVSLQSEIAKDVSAKLSPRLSGTDEAKVSKQATTDPVAYQAYLRGRYYWNKRTGEDMFKAIEQFQIAADRDKNYALAFTGLADSYSLLPSYSSNAPADSLSQAEKYAEQAIAIDGQLADPHAALGNIYLTNWRWTEAESEFKRALELNPNYATAYHWYSVLLFSLGRNEEGAAAITRAHELDPMSNIISQNYAQMLRMKGDQKAAIEVCQKIIELDPNFPGGHFAIAWSYLKTGRNDEAIAEFQKAAELNGRHSGSLGELGAALAISGRTKEAQVLIKELEERYRQGKTTGDNLASIYAALGDKDKAFEWLEKDIVSRNGELPQFRWSNLSEPLRDDPRFEEFIKRMGLPE